MNRELVKPHLYPRNRNPQGSKPSIQESDPSPLAKDAFALFSVDVRDRLRPRGRFFRIGRFGPEAHLRAVVRRAVVREEALFEQNPLNRFRPASAPAGPLPPRLRPRIGGANEALVRNCRRWSPESECPVESFARFGRAAGRRVRRLRSKMPSPYRQGWQHCAGTGEHRGGHDLEAGSEKAQNWKR